jgi:DNA-binding IclR family transcriptional regulator
MWRLGARWGVLGRAAVEQGALEATAMPFLTALGKTSGENVYLRVRDGLESETVAIYQADPGLRLYSEVGKRQPLHAGSSRLLLAHAPEAVQTQVLAQRLPRFTPATRTDAAWIAADLQRIRTRGYLLTTDEVVAGAATVAAPVRDASGQVVAVLSVSAPTMRMRPPRPRALLPMVLDAAAKLSRALGAAAADAGGRSSDVPARPAASAGTRRDNTAAPALVATGPHSMFR